MKLLLLKVLLQRRAKDEGFTLPMVIALGLVMILLGAVSITMANEENITAISQNSRSDALAIAEIGVARYRELLDRNRLLTLYDERLATTDEVTAGTDTERWEEIAQVCNEDIDSFSLGVSQLINLAEDGQILNNDGDSTDTFNIGSYSLVSYDYSNFDGVLNLTDDSLNNNARGILIVRGTAPNNAEAQIQVEIPIRLNPGDMTNLAPALWIGDLNNIATDLGNLTIGNGGKVVISDPAVTTGTTRDGCRDFSDTTVFPNLSNANRPVISDSRNVPAITSVETNITTARGDLTTASGSPINSLPAVNGSGQRIFATTTDTPYNPDPTSTSCNDIRDCRYYYDLPGAGGMSYTNEDLLTDGIAKTTLLLDESLTITATTRNIEVGSTSTVVNDSDSFEIYVKGNRTITLNATGGNIEINGFIHAPDSTLNITGGNNVTINGSVWVKDFVNTNTGTVEISPDDIKTDTSTEDKSYKFYSTTEGRTPRPITGSPTNWKTEQIN